MTRVSLCKSPAGQPSSGEHLLDQLVCRPKCRPIVLEAAARDGSDRDTTGRAASQIRANFPVIRVGSRPECSFGFSKHIFRLFGSRIQ